MKRRHIADPEPFPSPYMWSGEEFQASEIQAEPRLQPVFTAFSREGKEGREEEKSENSTNNVPPWILVKKKKEKKHPREECGPLLQTE